MLRNLLLILGLLAFSSIGAAEGDFTNTFQPGHSNFWYDATNPGTGVSIYIAGDTLGFAWYDRASDGSQSWLAGAGTIVPGEPVVLVEATDGKGLSRLVPIQVNSCSSLVVGTTSMVPLMPQTGSCVNECPEVGFSPPNPFCDR